ncbi:MAG TPA: response regulator transcription factor [Chitinophagales bacterium]|nr:response regulator transcription factor [Chitinophagales bacterium]
MNILVIEDDSTLNKNIREALEAEGYHAESVFDGLLAERILKNNQFDCIIMDINLPGKTGYDLSADYRKQNTSTPILMLTAFSELDDKVKGYESGADDYLTKPFYMRELILRVHSLIKRNQNSSAKNKISNTIIAGDLTIQDDQKKVFKQGKEVILTPREYHILLKLSENNGEIVSKKDLIEHIWGRSVDINTNTIEVYISFLRNKLDKPFGTNRIKTKVGYGYYLDE